MVNASTAGALADEQTTGSIRPGPVGAPIRIEPSTGWRKFNLREMWRHRELLYFLTWRDIKVRYKQTAFGAAWAILQPFLTMIVFTVVFGHLVNVPSDGAPYPLFALAALLPWMFFSNALTLGANSVISTPDLVTKIYFPRVIMPAASVLGGLLDFAIGFVILVGLMGVYGMTLGVHALLVIPLLALTVIAALGASLWLAAVNVEYRDVRYAVPFLVQTWLFVTPVAYPSSLATGSWRWVFGLNPMAGIVEGFRWALLGTEPGPGLMLITSSIAAIVMCATGLAYFARVEHRFADVI